jgi:hypothetical protein
MKKVTKNTTLAEILELPGAEEILAKYKVPCLTCPMAQFEIQKLTIGDVCKMYGIDVEGLICEVQGKSK